MKFWVNTILDMQQITIDSLDKNRFTVEKIKSKTNKELDNLLKKQNELKNNK